MEGNHRRKKHKYRRRSKKVLMVKLSSVGLLTILFVIAFILGGICVQLSNVVLNQREQLRDNAFIKGQLELLIPKKSIGRMQNVLANLPYYSQTEALMLAYYIHSESYRHGIDPWLAFAWMMGESGGNPNALSNKGAMSLYQVMPFHFQDNQDPYNLETNTKVGIGLIALNIKKYKNVARAIVGYNKGNCKEPWPGESIGLVQKVTGLYKKYKRI